MRLLPRTRRPIRSLDPGGYSRVSPSRGPLSITSFRAAAPKGSIIFDLIFETSKEGGERQNVSLKFRFDFWGPSRDIHVTCKTEYFLDHFCFLGTRQVKVNGTEF